MAESSTALSIQDNASPALANIERSINACHTTFNKLTAAFSVNLNIESINISVQAFDKMNQNVEEVENSVGKCSGAQEGFKNKLEESKAKAKALLESIGKVASKSMEAASKVMAISDSMTQNNTKIQAVNDGLQTTEQLNQMIQQSAQGSRTSYQSTVDAVTAMGASTGGVFSSTKETVGFVDLLSKSFKIAGASAEDIDSNMQQLASAMGEGQLQGEALNSVLSNGSISEGLQSYIQDIMGLDASNLRQLADEGVLTGEVLKNAMFYASSDINDSFAEIPMTWSEVAGGLKDSALTAFAPILQKVNEIANSEEFAGFTSGLEEGLMALGEVAEGVFDTIAGMGAWVYDNWSIIEPVIIGIAVVLGLYAAALAVNSVATGIATAAQAVLNSTLLACPLTWIVIAVIAVIAAFFALVAMFNKVTGSSYSATGIIMGCISMAIAFFQNALYGIVEFVLGIINYITSLFATFANFFSNVFSSPISSVIYMFQGLGDAVLGIVSKIAHGIDGLLGTNTAGIIDGLRTDLKAAADLAVQTLAPNENYEKNFEGTDFKAEDLGFKPKDYKDAYNSGYQMGDSFANPEKDKSGGGTNDWLSGIMNQNTAAGGNNYTTAGGGTDYDDLPANAASTATNTKAAADNTAKTADNVEISTEEIKYLKDIAEQDAINQFTTVPFSLTVQNTNQINKDLDIDTVCNGITQKLFEEIQISSESYHM